MSSKRKLGILLPADGPTDYEWYTLKEPGLPWVEVGQVESDGHHEPAALRSLGGTQRLARVGKPLVEQGDVQAVVWACTSGSFIGGLEWAKAQSRELETLLGVPVSSTALAFRDALQALAVSQVDLLSPYPEEVTRCLVTFLQESGVSVDRVKVLDCPYAEDSHEKDIIAEVRAFCAEHGRSGNTLLVPDTAVNTLSLLPAMQREAGCRVLTANQVTLWAGLRLLEWPQPPTEYLGDLAGL